MHCLNSKNPRSQVLQKKQNLLLDFDVFLAILATQPLLEWLVGVRRHNFVNDLLVLLIYEWKRSSPSGVSEFFWRSVWFLIHFYERDREKSSRVHVHERRGGWKIDNFSLQQTICFLLFLSWTLKHRRRLSIFFALPCFFRFALNYLLSQSWNHRGTQLCFYSFLLFNYFSLVSLAIKALKFAKSQHEKMRRKPKQKKDLFNSIFTSLLRL